MVIRLSGNRRVEVLPARSEAPDIAEGPRLVVWAQDGQDRWEIFTGKRPSTSVAEVPAQLREAARGDSGPPGPEAGVAMALPLDQLLGQVVIRGRGFITPAHHGRHLSGQITIRREALRGPKPYPHAMLTLRRAGSAGPPAATIRLADGQVAVRWAAMPALGEPFKGGLPPGEYTLHGSDPGESTTFTIAPPEERAWVFAEVEELSRRLGREDPLSVQVTAESLLAALDEDGKPQPYLADALDLLENVPPKSRTEHLERLRDETLRRLENQPQRTAADSQASGIAEIDRARRLIEQARWTEARDALSVAEKRPESRSQALAALYRAAILAESGPAAEESANRLFQRALEQIPEGSTADRFLALNNYGGFLANGVRDRLHNQAFQAASGVENQMTRALAAWSEAERHYRAALAAAERLPPRQRAATQVNLAQLYTLLADVIRTLDAPGTNGRRFEAGERAAAAEAEGYARAALEAKAGDRITRAVAEEVLAHLAYRQGRMEEVRRHAMLARAEYLEAGSIAGVEGIHRLLGLAEASASMPSESADASALRHLTISHLLAELLRQRIPSDHVGQTRAGFFARRAYVNERMVELLAKAGRAEEALHYAELAKARAFQDLCMSNPAVARTRAAEPRNASEILRSWPADVAAAEYFLGNRQAWVFVVTTGGKVQVHLLKDEWGQAILPAQLIRRVRVFLGGVEGQAGKMAQRLLSGRGFDNGWQDELHALCNTLLPGPALAELRKAKQVVLVPQHILHYFPFAALVTQRDAVSQEKTAVAKPRFLLDEPFHLTYVPSLGSWDGWRRQPAPAMRQAAAMGIVEVPGAPPLPGVDTDLANFKEAFGDRVRTIRDKDQAREAVAKQMLGEPGVLLFATHGFNNADRPLESYLLYLPDDAAGANSGIVDAEDSGDRNDGRLTARETFAQRVEAGLVVMSACYSGLGDRSPLPGDDLFGLQRALLQSGARSVVSGLWDVYDGTAPELLKGFMQRVAQGTTVAEALAGTQREFLQKLRASEQPEPWLHPYFWAVYTVAGDGDLQFAREGPAHK